MNAQGISPAGIVLLQGIPVEKTITVSSRKFNRIVKILLTCSLTADPEVILCDYCFYKKICLRRFDKLCDKVETFKIIK
jgi:hypothetical protein